MSDTPGMKQNICIHWFRRDLRLLDNPALSYAAKNFDAVLPLYIWSPDEETPWEPGAASKWWLHHSLEALQSSLTQRGLPLVIRSGKALNILQAIVAEVGAETIVWNRLYDPRLVQRDSEIKAELKEAGLGVHTFNGSLLIEPWEIQTATGKPYRVFTPFWKKLRASFSPRPLATLSKSIAAVNVQPASEKLESLRLLPQIDWAEGFREAWTPGEEGGKKLLRKFLRYGAANYAEARNAPAANGNSALSPHLHFGELSPNQIWNAAQDEVTSQKLEASDLEPFLRQLGWRDFAHGLLFHFPSTPELPLYEKYANFPWKPDAEFLRAWQQGKTGYPFVDAGMRELWRTGVMHNRVRMVVASFLVKHLLQPWQDGAAWFWDTLVDADLANNTMGWQWVAGCGADAAPYFRVFNPFGQGERFDADGSYTRRWVPELANLPNKYLHTPWEAPSGVLAEAKVRLGVDYPLPIIEHKEGRERALEAYAEIK